MLPEEDTQVTSTEPDVEEGLKAESGRNPESAVETTEPIVLHSDSDNQVDNQDNEDEVKWRMHIL